MVGARRGFVVGAAAGALAEGVGAAPGAVVGTAAGVLRGSVAGAVVGGAPGFVRGFQDGAAPGAEAGAGIGRWLDNTHIGRWAQGCPAPDAKAADGVQVFESRSSTPPASEGDNPNGPEQPDFDWTAKQTYQDASYHGRAAQAGPHGVKSAAPQDGTAALRHSYRVSESAPRRIGVDAAHEEFVVLDRTQVGQGLWHGHVRTWDQLTQNMRNALTSNGITSNRGKLIAQ